MITYSLKPVNLIAEAGEVKIPTKNERIIQMHGTVIEFTLQGIADTQNERSKKVKELEAKKELEEKKIKNIEEHHAFVKDFTDEDLHAMWMYYECKALVSECGKEAEKIKGYIKADNEAIEDIKKQIKELC
jgi:hypothetical protein